MTVKDLEVMFEYGYWANDRLFEVLSKLSDDQFTKTVAGGHGSLRNTMVHILSAQWGWIDRCGGTARGAALDPVQFPTIASLLSLWHQVDGYLREFFSTLHDEVLHRTVEFAFGSGPRYAMPLGALLQHAAFHSIHHRGQVALMLRSLGNAPGNFDFLFYFARPQ